MFGQTQRRESGTSFQLGYSKQHGPSRKKGLSWSSGLIENFDTPKRTGKRPPSRVVSNLGRMFHGYAKKVGNFCMARNSFRSFDPVKIAPFHSKIERLVTREMGLTPQARTPSIGGPKTASWKSRLTAGR